MSCRDHHSLAAAEVIIALAEDAVRRIACDLFRREFDGHRIMFRSQQRRAAAELLASDGVCMVVDASRAALQRVERKALAVIPHYSRCKRS